MKLGKFTARIFICISISLLALSVLILCASAAFAQERRPLSVADIETLLKSESSPKRVEQLVNERGVNFEISANVRGRLSNAGADPSVLQAIEKASAAYVKARSVKQPPVTSPDPERAKLEEENRKLREALEREEAKRKEQAARAKLEEENTKLRDALKRAEEEKKKAAEPVVATAPPALQQTSRDGAEMVSVPAGEFWMGSDDSDAYSDEKPRRRVYLDAFRIDKFEASNALYRRFMEATGRAAPSYWNDSMWNEPSQPVVGVDWYDASAYCSWAGKRLPTEAEWEKAARGTDGRKYPWGDQWDSSRANSAESKIGKMVSVGSYPSGVSPYGAHDMAGNVWEWVADWYGDNYYSQAPNRNPKGPDSGQYRVLRGGSWFNLPRGLRVSLRNRLTPAYRGGLIGFRCAQ